MLDEFKRDIYCICQNELSSVRFIFMAMEGGLIAKWMADLRLKKQIKQIERSFSGEVTMEHIGQE